MFYMTVGGWTAAVDKWDRRFFNLAKEVSTWSKDPSTGVGCVAVKDRRVVSTGFNGFPEGVDDSEIRLNDTELKYKLTVHAEQNAVYNAAKEGVSLKGAALYVHGLPCCHECAKAIVQAGIREVYMQHGPMKDKWRHSFEYSKLLFDEAGVRWACVEVCPGLPEGPHREQGCPGPGNEPLKQQETDQELDLRSPPEVDD